MYLSRLYIKNYKSINEIDLVFQKGRNVIVGRNNSGKSNLFKALNIVLGESSPTYDKSENITEDDFYTWKEIKKEKIDVQKSKEIFIWCELKRETNETLNYDEIYKCWGYYRLVSERIAKNDLPKNYSKILDYKEEELQSQEKKYINPKLKNQKTFENELDDKYSFAFAFFATLDENGNINKDIRFLYRESEVKDWILAFKAPIRNELLQSAIIPSFRDPQNQLRLSSWTWYGKLMKFLTEKHAKNKDLNDAFGDVKKVADAIFDSVRKDVSGTTLEVAFPGTEIHFQFNADTKTDIYKSCVIYIDDGFKSLLTEKGAGIQSATIIGLFNYFTREVNTKTSALLCVEEPELYLHPHARRVISDRLDEFMDNHKNQVIITTHSTDFIRTTDENLNIVLIRKGEKGTTGLPMNISNSKSLLLNNNHNEIFFADKIIICEGLDDYILRWVAKESFPNTLDEKNISVITAGGKDNFKKFTDMAHKLQIDCYIFADFDYFLRDTNQEANKYKEEIKKDGKINKIVSYSHQSISDLGEAFFKQKCIFGIKGDEKFNAIKTFRAEIKKNQEENFYKAKKLDQLGEVKGLKSFISEIRSSGVGILEGEIEDLSSDQLFLSTDNKLDLPKIFQISTKLVEGKKISEIINTKPIEEFLKNILDT